MVSSSKVRLELSEVLAKGYCHIILSPDEAEKLSKTFNQFFNKTSKSIEKHIKLSDGEILVYPNGKIEIIMYKFR